MLLVVTEDQALPHEQIFTWCNLVDVSTNILNVCLLKAVQRRAQRIFECGRRRAVGTCADVQLEPVTAKVILEKFRSLHVQKSQ